METNEGRCGPITNEPTSEDLALGRLMSTPGTWSGYG